jgi:hypothetical protein
MRRRPFCKTSKSIANNSLLWLNHISKYLICGLTSHADVEGDEFNSTLDENDLYLIRTSALRYYFCGFSDARILMGKRMVIYRLPRATRLPQFPLGLRLREGARGTMARCSPGLYGETYRAQHLSSSQVILLILSRRNSISTEVQSRDGTNQRDIREWAFHDGVTSRIYMSTTWARRHTDSSRYNICFRR